MKNTKRTMFVTVGTTSFDCLISSVSTYAFIEAISALGYSRLVIQYGRGAKPTLDNVVDTTTKNLVEVESYCFKPSLQPDMEAASIIISHAGAGSIMECLNLRKRCVVVINDSLMDNHQWELASALESRGFLKCLAKPDLLISSGVLAQAFQGVPFGEDRDEMGLVSTLDDMFGFAR